MKPRTFLIQNVPQTQLISPRVCPRASCYDSPGTDGAYGATSYAQSVTFSVNSRGYWPLDPKINCVTPQSQHTSHQGCGFVCRISIG
eukprot:500000-Rhodomonas_salina.1